MGGLHLWLPLTPKGVPTGKGALKRIEKAKWFPPLEGFRIATAELRLARQQLELTL